MELLALRRPPSVGGRRLQPGVADRVERHAVAVVEDVDATLARLQGTAEADEDARRVGVIGVLHELDDGHDLRGDELVAERPHDPGTRPEWS